MPFTFASVNSSLLWILLFRTLLALFEDPTGVDPQKPHPNRFLDLMFSHKNGRCSKPFCTGPARKVRTLFSGDRGLQFVCPLVN